MGSGEHCSNPCRLAGSKDPSGVSQRPAKKVPGLSRGGNQMGAETKWEQSLLKTESAEMDRASGRLGKERRVSLIFARALGFLLRIVIG